MRCSILLMLASCCSSEILHKIDDHQNKSKGYTASLYKQIPIKSIKWSEILKTAGVSTLVSPHRLNHRQPWCRSQKLVLEVSMPGCVSRNILSRFCFGQCSSFYIPRPGAHFQSCPSCLPSKGVWTVPLLSCGGQAKRARPVFRVKRCKCLSPK